MFRELSKLVWSFLWELDLFIYFFYWRWSLSQEGLAICAASKEYRTRGRSYLPGWPHSWINLVHTCWSQILLSWTYVWKVPYFFFFLNFLTFYVGILIPYLTGLRWCMSKRLFAKSNMGFPGGSSGKEPTCQCRRCKRCGLDPWVGKIPWRSKGQPTLVVLPGTSHRRRSLARIRCDWAWGQSVKQ